MANFDAQIQALTGTATNSEMNQWMNDGTREVMNILPPHLKQYCFSKQTFTSNAANSEAETMITGQLGSVYAGSVECRQIRPMDKHKASSSSSIEYASATDPVYYIEGNKINILPSSSSGVYYVIANPSITASDVSSIDNFPNEAEYLVVLYAAIKVLQNKMNEMNSLAAIDTTAFGAITTELNKVDNIIDEASGKIDDYYTSIGDIDDTTELWDNTNKRFTVVRDALLLAQNLIDNDQPNSNYDAYANLADVDEAMSAIDTHLDDSEAVLGSNPSSGDISTALGLIKTAIDQAASAADKFEAADGDSIFGDEATFLTADSQLTHVNDALIKAQNLIDGATMDGDTEPQSAQYWLNDEDTEMVQATLQTAQSEIQRAQTSIQHWSSIGDMRVKEIQAALAEADGYAKEVQARLTYAKAYSEAAVARKLEGEGRITQLNATVSVANQELQRAQIAIAEINTLMASYKIELEGVPMYLQEATSYIAQAQGYIGESKIRMEREFQKYGWYQAQQLKLQQDYDKGIQMLVSGGLPKPVKEAK